MRTSNTSRMILDVTSVKIQHNLHNTTSVVSISRTTTYSHLSFLEKLHKTTQGHTCRKPQIISHIHLKINECNYFHCPKSFQINFHGLNGLPANKHETAPVTSPFTNKTDSVIYSPTESNITYHIYVNEFLCSLHIRK